MCFSFVLFAACYYLLIRKVVAMTMTMLSCRLAVDGEIFELILESEGVVAHCHEDCMVNMC